MTKHAQVIGATGQDGICLAQKGYEGQGVKRRVRLFDADRIGLLRQDPRERGRRLVLRDGDVTDATNLRPAELETVLLGSPAKSERLLGRVPRVRCDAPVTKTARDDPKTVERDALRCREGCTLTTAMSDGVVNTRSRRHGGKACLVTRGSVIARVPPPNPEAALHPVTTRAMACVPAIQEA